MKPQRRDLDLNKARENAGGEAKMGGGVSRAVICRARPGECSDNATADGPFQVTPFLSKPASKAPRGCQRPRSETKEWTKRRVLRPGKGRKDDRLGSSRQNPHIWVTVPGKEPPQSDMKGPLKER
ncbi:hypothetical protein MRX96_006907 [Rhipicephalus microplus]